MVIMSHVGSNEVKELDERFLIYSALIIVCVAVGTFLGVTAGVWSFFQVAAVVELTYWIGTSDQVTVPATSNQKNRR